MDASILPPKTDKRLKGAFRLPDGARAVVIRRRKPWPTQQELLRQAYLKLDRQALLLQAAAEVSRVTGSILDPDS